MTRRKGNIRFHWEKFRARSSLVAWIPSFAPAAVQLTQVSDLLASGVARAWHSTGPNPRWLRPTRVSVIQHTRAGSNADGGT